MQQPTKTAGPSTPNTMTTEDIQKCLDENKRLIWAIMENNNLGRTAESAQYQAQLQQNLIYLAAIADVQPQAPAATSQTPPQSVAQQEQHIQLPQPEMAQQQQGVLTPNFPFQLNALQSRDQQHHQLLQQQQHLKGLQSPPQSVVQQEQHIQLPQPEMAQQQQSVLTPNFPFQLNALQSRDQQHHQLLQQQQMGQQHHQLLQQQQMGTMLGANTSMHQAMQLGIGNSGFPRDARSASRQDLLETGSGGSQGGNSASGLFSGERDFRL